FTYTPTAGYGGADSFQYQVSDGAASATATVSLNVHLPVTHSWTGNGPDDLASDPANWDDNTAPAAGDSLYFGGNGKTAVLDAALPDELANITIAASFSGSVEVAGNVTISGTLQQVRRCWTGWSRSAAGRAWRRCGSGSGGCVRRSWPTCCGGSRSRGVS